MANKCVVDKAVSKKGLFVVVAAGAGAFLLPQNSVVGAVVGGFAAMLLAGVF